ncbi:hypothetical protein B0H19DRAFT_1085082 [Mycena capillaripes]|nr:hypothetical protein B0H19DRAFT_1085082 [Mycena capillaripes]
MFEGIRKFLHYNFILSPKIIFPALLTRGRKAVEQIRLNPSPVNGRGFDGRHLEKPSRHRPVEKFSNPSTERVGYPSHGTRRAGTTGTGIRVMTNRKSEARERIPKRTRRRLLDNNTPDSVTVHISSATHAPPRRRKTAAAGAVYGINDRRNKGFRIPVDEDQTPYVAEMFAALDAVRNTDTGVRLTIVSTQSFVETSMNKRLTAWEREGWMGVRHRNVLRCLAAELKARRGPTLLVIAQPGAAGRDHLRQATVLAKQAAISDRVTPVDLSVPNDMALPGVSLTENRQRANPQTQSGVG